MQLIDLSHTLEAGMPCYPGTPAPVFQSLASLETEGFVEQLITFSSHTGTHIDLPSHILSRGLSLDAFALEQFTGSGVVIDLRSAAGGIITKEMLHPFQPLLLQSDFLLLCSGWSRYWGTSDYYEGYPVLTSDAACWLAGFNLKGIGVDMISLDAHDSVDFPIHHLLLQSGMILIENLADLAPLLHRSFIIACFPLKIFRAEASPVRALAFA